MFALACLYQSMDDNKSMSVVLSLDPRQFDPKIIDLLGTAKFDPITDVPFSLLVLAIGFWTAYKFFSGHKDARPILAQERPK